MPFHDTIRKNSLITNQKKNSLQTHHDISTPNDRMKYFSERVSPFTFYKASLTVEASMVLPIFLFAICFMMYFTEIVRTQAEIGNEIYKQGKQLSLYSYVYDKVESEGLIHSGIVEDLVSGGLSSLYVKSQINNALGENYCVQHNIPNGINLMLSKYMQEEDMIDIIAVYRIKIPCNFFHVGKVLVLQRCRMRAWTGYQATSGGDPSEEIVYITPNGTVYHTSPTCTHINLSISGVSIHSIEGLRNSGGGKYYECELCEGEATNGQVYITDTGDRYHNSRECSGLKRGITAIPISQVEGRRPCSRCGN